MKKIIAWFDSSAANAEIELSHDEKEISWTRVLPFLLVHLSCFLVILVGWSSVAIAVAVILYFVRMFAITGFYHRYFSHKAFKTSRPVQFIFAFLGATAAQRGPLWWASHHRHHHAKSDLVEDSHSPVQHGFLWSHLGWFLANKNYVTKMERVRELSEFPELRFLDRFDSLAPLVLMAMLYGLGAWLAIDMPSLNTSGPQMLVWGFSISTVFVYHMTFTVNSLAHVWGKRRFKTNDDSRNNLLIALVTLGEGWHNNHHHFPSAARQGFYWWEVDLTYYGLRTLALFGIVWDLRQVPVNVLEQRRHSR